MECTIAVTEQLISLRYIMTTAFFPAGVLSDRTWFMLKPKLLVTVVHSGHIGLDGADLGLLTILDSSSFPAFTND